LQTKPVFQKKKQQEKQQQKLFTFKDIAPKWAKRLEQQQLEEELPHKTSLAGIKWYFELLSYSRCVVGEAHGFSSSYVYNCRKCCSFGWKFIESYNECSCSKFEKNKEEFIKHWNEEHTSSSCCY
jgi:hypothetical protein